MDQRKGRPEAAGCHKSSRSTEDTQVSDHKVDAHRAHDLAAVVDEGAVGCEQVAAILAPDAAIDNSGDNDDDVVLLNVGGTEMATRRSTLTMTHKGSMLALAFAPDSDARWRLPRLPNGAYFLDLDPDHFRAVLGVLRHGTAALAALDASSKRGVALVADYLNMPALVATCTSDLARHEVDAIEPHKSVTISVMVIEPDGTLPHAGLDICDWTLCPKVTVLDSWNLSRVRDVVAAEVDIDARSLDVYPCIRRVDGRVIPGGCLLIDDDHDPRFGSVSWKSGIVSDLDRVCWVVRDRRWIPRDEVVAPVALVNGHDLPYNPPTDRVYVVFKRYDHATGTIGGCIVMGVDVGSSISSALPECMKRLHMTDDDLPVRSYCEMGSGSMFRTGHEAPFGLPQFCIIWLVSGTAGDTPPSMDNVTVPGHLNI
jgi:hypothetical protein